MARRRLPAGDELEGTMIARVGGGVPPLTFRPRPSLGWLWLVGIAAIVLLVTVAPLLPVLSEVSLAIVLITLVPGLAIGAAFLVIASWLPTMRYELDDRRLTLRCGPLLTYRIPLDEIRELRRKNLKISLWSSLRLPGVALFTVLYADEGRVKMCATSSATDILLIDTDHGTYGITPTDEAAFVAAIRARIGG